MKFGPLLTNQVSNALLTLLNDTTDVNTNAKIAPFVELDLHSAQLTGPDAGKFSLPSFSEKVLAQNGSLNLILIFPGRHCAGHL